MASVTDGWCTLCMPLWREAETDALVKFYRKHKNELPKLVPKRVDKYLLPEEIEKINEEFPGVCLPETKIRRDRFFGGHVRRYFNM